MKLKNIAVWMAVLLVGLSIVCRDKVKAQSQTETGNLQTQVTGGGKTAIRADFTGTLESRKAESLKAHPDDTTATPPTPPVIAFNPAQVGITAGSAQQLTATFFVSGYTGSFTPTAMLHYGKDYTAGAVSCAASGGGENCSIVITFIPTLPGGRKDALFLMDGTARLASVLLGGVGTAPLALMQPGLATQLVSGTTYDNYNVAVDENGVVYVVGENSNTVHSIALDGTVATLPVTVQGPWGIAIDGAGVLYIAQNTYSHTLITYDTVQGIAGTLCVAPTSLGYSCASTLQGEYLLNVAVDPFDNVFALETNTGYVFELEANGTYKTTAISPAITQPSQIAVDPADDIFVGGYTINSISYLGSQGEINTTGAGDGLAVDAAETLYATRYSVGSYDLALLSINDYSTALAGLDSLSSAPLGLGIGSDGTVYVGNGTEVDKVDRSQGAIAFGEQSMNTPSSVQQVGVYNGGNENLTVDSFAVTGTGFTIQNTSVTNACTDALVLTPGELCYVGVVANLPGGGNYTGTLTFTTNSLYQTTTQSVALSGFVYGPNVTASPSLLSFGNQNTGTTSAAETVTLTNTGLLYYAYFNPATVPTGFTVNYGSGAAGTCSANLAPGATCTLTVTFSPTAAQSYGGTVSVPVSSSGGGGPFPSATFTVSGTGQTPTPIAALTSTLGFPNTNAGSTSSSLAAVLSNSGSAPLTISSIALGGTNPSDFAITTGTNACSTSSSVAAGTSCNIYVTFSPAAAQSYSATLTVTDNASPTTQTSALSGTGTAPLASLTSTLSFPSTNVGSTSSSLTAVLSNSGTAPLTISAISIVGANPSDFTITTGTNSCSTSTALNSEATCNIYVTFTPAAAQSYTATLQVTDNASPTTQTSALSGTGAGPSASLTNTLSFPNTTVGTTSAALAAVLSNTGTAPLTISTISMGGVDTTAFTITTGTNACSTSVSVAAGSSCNIYVTFTPSAVQSYTAAVNVTDNANPTTQLTTLTGTGTGTPIAGLTSALNFPSTTIGTTSSSLTAVLTNSGTAPLTISSIALGGVSPSDFTITTGSNACSTSASVAVGASCNIYVTFTPSAVVSYTATLTVTDNASPTTQTSGLTGTGLGIPAASLTSTLSFPSTTAGTTSASLIAVLSNSGTAPLTLSAITIAGVNPSDFTVTTGTNACASTTVLSVEGSCNIYVTFSPAAAQSYSATLTVTDNASPTTQTSALTGTGTTPPDFTISVTPGAQTINANGTATYTVLVGSSNGAFANAVALSVTGLPSGAQANFTPTSVTPGSEGGTSTLTISTAPLVVSNQAPSRWPLLTLALLMFVPFKRLRKSWTGRIAMMIGVLAIFSVMTGCGGGFKLTPNSVTYTLTVTGTSGIDTHSTTVQLTVQ